MLPKDTNPEPEMKAKVLLTKWQFWASASFAGLWACLHRLMQSGQSDTGRWGIAREGPWTDCYSQHLLHFLLQGKTISQALLRVFWHWSILHFSNSLTSIEHPSIKLNSGIMRSQHTSTGWKIQLTLQYQDSLQSQHFWPIMLSLSQIVCSRSHFIHYDRFITEAMVPFIVKDAVLKFPMGNSEYAKPETWVSWQSSHRFWHQFQMPPITLFRGFMDGSLCWVDWWNHWPLVFKKF